MQSPSPFTVASDAAMRRALVVGVVASTALGVVVLGLAAVTLNALVGLLVGVLLMVLLSAGWLTHVQQGFGGAMESVVEDLGEEVPADGEPAMRNALEGVAILTGVRAPELRVLDTDAANAMVASDGDRSTVVVTSGLLRGCRTVESEVIAAELLCRVRDDSARYGTLVAGLPPLLRRAAGLDELSAARLLGDQRAVHADADAIAVTRYPPGLVSAFERMATAGTAVKGADPDTASLWIAPAVGVAEGVPDALDRTVNQPLEYRIAVLREL